MGLTDNVTGQLSRAKGLLISIKKKEQYKPFPLVFDGVIRRYEGGYICTEMSLSKRLKCLKVRWREKLGTNRIVKLISESHFQILFPDCNFPFFLGDSKNMHFYIIDFHIQFYSSLVGGAMIFCNDRIFTTKVARLSRCTFTFPNWRTV